MSEDMMNAMDDGVYSTPLELDRLVRGYSDKKLAELYRTASKEWKRILSDEIGRRDGGGR